MTGSLGEALVAAGALSAEQLRESLAFCRGRGLRLSDALRELGFVDETVLARELARAEGLPFIDLSRGKIPPELLARVPPDVARAQRLLPVAERRGALVVAIDDPDRRIAAGELAFVLGCEVACALAAPGAHRAALERCYGPLAEVRPRTVARQADADDGDAPIVRLVTRLFADALARRASDIHLEPQGRGAGRLRVRFRVDGVLQDAAEHPLHLAAPVTSRIKVLAALDIAEKRKPQDGRIGLELGDRHVDVRVSILPTNHGETVVLRLLDRSGGLLSLEEIGLSGSTRERLRPLLLSQNGIVLVTGPTGSGKTTTLYAALSELNRPDTKIITAEDPVEYHIAGIHQIQVNPRVGLTFARILRSMLRAAPNVILVGEIRDLETAETAVQAALTGHLVFSTLHTNDAPGALTRLLDLGVKPFLVSTAVRGVLAQRLVRRLCTECATPHVPAAEELAALGLPPEARGEWRRPRGCRACDGQGYRGRLGLFELLELDAPLRELVFRGAAHEELRAAARAMGRLFPLLADGADKVAAGLTSTAEVLRVVRSAVVGGGA